MLRIRKKETKIEEREEIKLEEKRKSIFNIFFSLTKEKWDD